MGFLSRRDAGPAEPPLYDGLHGLESTDPAELAARVFLMAFSGEQGSHVRPERVLGVLQQLAGLDEIPRIIVRGTMATPRARYSLDPLYVQCVLLWERALIAGRLSRGSEAYHHIVLLPQGRRALAGGEPETAVLQLLG